MASDTGDWTSVKDEGMHGMNQAKRMRQQWHRISHAMSTEEFKDKQAIRLETNKLIKLEEHRFMQQRKMMSNLTRMSGSGGMFGNVMNMLQGIGGMKVGNYQRLQELSQKKTLSTSEAKEKSMLQGGTSNALLGRLDSLFEKTFGGDSKWNKMFGGQGKVAAAGLGMGAVGGGLAIGKAIIDSSMMLQQMLKLLQFGVMLILKPIGDFFGFLMRPIMILLLRKFIIPFYQKVYPWFATTGTKIGNNIATIMDNLNMETLGVAVAGAIVAALIKHKVIPALPKVNAIPTPPLAPTSNTAPYIKDGKMNYQGLKDLKNQSMTNFTKSNIPDSKTKLPPALSDKVIKQYQQGTGEVSFEANKKKTSVFNQLIQHFDKINNITSKRNWNPKVVKNMINLGKSMFKGLPVGMAADAMGVTDAVLDDVFKLVEGLSGLAGVKVDLPTMSRPAPDLRMAGGGIINEPVSGIGQRSGKSYLLGEAGREMVVPMSRSGGIGGTTVNISIGNMSGNANDLNKLRSTILEVMQTVNVNRGR